MQYPAILHFINTHFDTCNSSQQESNPGSHWLELPVSQLLSYSCQSITSTLQSFIIMYCTRDIEYSSLNNWQPHLCMCYLKSVRCNIDQKVLFIKKEAMLCDFSDCKCYRSSCIQHCKCMFDQQYGAKGKSQPSPGIEPRVPPWLELRTSALTNHQPSQSSDLPHTIKHMSIFVGRKVTENPLGIKSKTFRILVDTLSYWTHNQRAAAGLLRAKQARVFN